MIYQRFGQGVSNLSTVAELRTFDGTGGKFATGVNDTGGKFSGVSTTLIIATI
jgi:hypothetical protein